MKKCIICGASINKSSCEFDVPIEKAPWIGDYNAIAKGKINHYTHQLMVARWNLHHASEISPKVLRWAKGIIQTSKK